MGNLWERFGLGVAAPDTGVDDGARGSTGGRGTARLLHAVAERLADGFRLGFVTAGALILGGTGGQAGGRVTAGLRPGVAQGGKK